MGLLLVLTGTGCVDFSSGGGATTTTITVDLGNDAEFSLQAGTSETQEQTVDISADLPGASPSTGSLRLLASEVSVIPTGEVNTPLVDVTLRFAASNDDNPCDSDATVGPFEISVNTTGQETIDPAISTLDSDTLDIVLDGQFQICVDATADGDANVDIGPLELILTSTSGSGGCAGYSTMPTCAQLQAEPEVNQALATLANENYHFVPAVGSTPANLLGNWNYSRVVEFDPDGTNTGDTSDGVLRFSERTGGSIVQTIGGVALEHAIEGNGDLLSLCASARDGDSSCEQTRVGITSYKVGPGGDTLCGNFLSVVVCLSGGGSASCGDVGDFIFGTITLVRSDRVTTPPAVSMLGKVVLPAGVVPDWLVMRPDGSGGVVTGSAGEIFSFEAEAPFTTRPVTLPIPSTFPFNGIGLTRDGSRYGLIADGLSRLFVLNTTDDSVARQATSPGFNLTGGAFDFSPDGSQVYLLSPHSGDADNVVILPGDAGPEFAAADSDRIPTPLAQSPRASRLNADGTQLAVLIAGSGEGDSSTLLAFLNTGTRSFGSLVDLAGASGGGVRDDQMLYSPDNGHVLLAGAAGVVAVDSASPFDVSVARVARTEGDETVALAANDDGDVIAVGVLAEGGNVDFAVLDAGTLMVLNRQELSDVHGRVKSVAYFPNAPAALVAPDAGSSVVAVATTAPYDVLGTLSVTETGSDATIGRMAAGGDLIAVVNVDEPAVYLFRAAP